MQEGAKNMDIFEDKRIINRNYASHPVYDIDAINR